MKVLIDPEELAGMERVERLRSRTVMQEPTCSRADSAMRGGYCWRTPAAPRLHNAVATWRLMCCDLQPSREPLEAFGLRSRCATGSRDLGGWNTLERQSVPVVSELLSVGQVAQVPADAAASPPLSSVARSATQCRAAAAACLISSFALFAGRLAGIPSSTLVDLWVLVSVAAALELFVTGALVARRDRATP